VYFTVCCGSRGCSPHICGLVLRVEACWSDHDGPFICVALTVVSLFARTRNSKKPQHDHACKVADKTLSNTLKHRSFKRNQYEYQYSLQLEKLRPARSSQLPTAKTPDSRPARLTLSAQTARSAILVVPSVYCDSAIIFFCTSLHHTAAAHE
jgi:hypothetical protein